MIRFISFYEQPSLAFSYRDKTKKLSTQLFLDYLAPFLDASGAFSLKHVNKPFGDLYSRMRCLRMITDCLNVSDTCALNMTCRQWRRLSSTLWQEQPRRQLLCVMQIAHAQLGKKIIELWRNNHSHSHLSHDELRAEVHRRMYPEQSEKLHMFTQNLAHPSLDRQPDVEGVIDVLSEPVFFPAYRQSLKENELNWDMYVNSCFLDDSHILHDLVPPSFLLPSRCKDLVKRSKEKYFEKMTNLIRQIRVPHHREIIWRTLIKRCHVTGLHHLVPPLFKEFEQPCARINVQIEHYLHTQNFNLALTHAMQMRVLEKEEERRQNRWTTPFLGRNPSGDIEQMVVDLVKQRKEEKALSLLLNNDLFREATLRAAGPVSCPEDLEVRRDPLKEKFPLQVLVQLMILSYHYQGIDKTIQLVAGIPYQQIRTFIINHLILRLAQPARYVDIWEYHIEKLLIPKRKMSDGELMERCAQMRTHFTATELGLPSSLPTTPEQTALEVLKSTAFIRDIEKAIEIFNKYPTHEDSPIKLSLIWRSIYIIDALLELGDTARAKKFLPYLQFEEAGFGFRFLVSMDRDSSNDYPRVIDFAKKGK